MWVGRASVLSDQRMRRWCPMPERYLSNSSADRRDGSNGLLILLTKARRSLEHLSSCLAEPP